MEYCNCFHFLIGKIISVSTLSVQFTRHVGDRAFWSFGSRLWNRLPHIRCTDFSILSENSFVFMFFLCWMIATCFNVPVCLLAVICRLGQLSTTLYFSVKYTQIFGCAQFKMAADPTFVFVDASFPTAEVYRKDFPKFKMAQLSSRT